VLDDAILERVKRDHHQARPDRQAVRHSRQKCVDVVELAVHPDAERLERARRRIDPRESAPRHCSSHDRRQLRSRLERGCGPRLHDAPRDSPRVPLLAKLINRIGDLRFLSTAQQLGCGRAGRRVHSHVERIVALKAEPAAFGFELIGRHAHVRQGAVDTLDSAGLKNRRDRPIIRVHELYAIAVFVQRLGRDAQRRGSRSSPITLAGPGFEQGECMPAHADRAIHEDAALLRLQERDRLARHHRFVKHAFAPLQTAIRQRPRVVVGKRLALQFCDEPLVVPDFKKVELAEHIDFPDHRRRLTQPSRNHHTPLAVDFGDLAVKVHAVQELRAGWVSRGNLRQLFFDVGPTRHGVDTHRVPVQTGNEQFAPVFILDERAEPIGDLESPPIINFRRRVAPKHARLLHFSPKKSIAIVEKRSSDVNAKT
jgi:hypothetical protein